MIRRNRFFDTKYDTFFYNLLIYLYNAALGKGEAARSIRASSTMFLADFQHFFVFYRRNESL